MLLSFRFPQRVEISEMAESHEDHQPGSALLWGQTRFINSCVVSLQKNYVETVPINCESQKKTILCSQKPLKFKTSDMGLAWPSI